MAGTSIEAVCQAAGLTKPTVYWHFGSKEGLIAAAIEHATGRMIERLESPAPTLTQVPGNRLQEFIDRWREVILEGQSDLRVTSAVSAELAGRSEPVRKALSSAMQQSEIALARGMERAIGQSMHEVEGLAHAALMLLVGAQFRFQIDRDEAQLDRHLAELGRVIALGVADRLKAPRGASQITPLAPDARN